MPARKNAVVVPVLNRQGKVSAVMVAPKTKTKGKGLKLAGNGFVTRGRGGLSLGGLSGLNLPAVSW